MNTNQEADQACNNRDITLEKAHQTLTKLKELKYKMEKYSNNKVVNNERNGHSDAKLKSRWNIK